jgi:deoxyxylulose-5-phosphate synthase
MRFVKPLDTDLLHRIFSRFRKLITVENGALQGGFGSAVIEFMTDHRYTQRSSDWVCPTGLLNRDHRTIDPGMRL